MKEPKSKSRPTSVAAQPGRGNPSSRQKTTVLPGPHTSNPQIPVNDPHNINARLQRQVSELLKQLEDQDETVTLKERYMALASIARIQYIFVNLRKEKIGDPDVGTTVRKYAGAFAKQDDARRRKAATGPTPGPEPDEPWWDNEDDDGDDGDAA